MTLSDPDVVFLYSSQFSYVFNYSFLVITFAELGTVGPEVLGILSKRNGVCIFRIYFCSK